MQDPARRKIATRPVFQPGFCGAAAVVRAIDPVEGFDVGAKKSAAP
jgi:hypothetical protein